ncbi:hypothetical protein Tco_1438463 [Tanacetum coccineum]
MAVHSIKQREGESVRAFATRYTDDTLQILGLHEDQRISGFVHGLRTRNLVKHLSTDLPSTYKGLMEKTYTWFKARKVATNGASNDQRYNFERSRKSSWDNDMGQKSRDRFSPYRGPNHGLLTSLSRSPREILATEKIKEAVKRKLAQGTIYLKAPPSKEGKSHSPNIFEREVGRVHMDSSSLYEVIYEHCFLKLKPSIQASKVDSQVSLVGFLGEKSRAIREVLLEITIGDTPL